MSSPRTAPRTSGRKRTVSQEPPRLFEPKWVCAASLLFTPIYGGLLQARNWDSLGNPDEARASRHWVRMSIWLVVLYFVMQVLFRNEPVMTYAGPYFLFVLWAAWMLTSGMRQLRYVKTQVPEYERLPFGRTMSMGVLGWVLYGMISATITLALVLTGFEPLEVAGTAGTSETGVVISREPGTEEPVVRPMTPEESEAAAKQVEEAGIGRVTVSPDFGAKP